MNRAWRDGRKGDDEMNEEERILVVNIIRAIELRAATVASDEPGIWTHHPEGHLRYCKRVLLEMAERCTIFLDEYGYSREFEEHKEG